MKKNKLVPGKVIVHNVVQEPIHKAYISGFSRGSYIVQAFDTDIDRTEVLKENLALLRKYSAGVKIVFLAQVLNFEDELSRATDMKHAQELTESRNVRSCSISIRNFHKCQHYRNFCKHSNRSCKQGKCFTFCASLPLLQVPCNSGKPANIFQEDIAKKFRKNRHRKTHSKQTCSKCFCKQVE